MIAQIKNLLCEEKIVPNWTNNRVGAMANVALSDNWRTTALFLAAALVIRCAH